MLQYFCNSILDVSDDVLFLEFVNGVENPRTSIVIWGVSPRELLINLHFFFQLINTIK